MSEALYETARSLAERIQAMERKEQDVAVAQSAAASASLTLTTSFADVVGATLQATAGHYLATAIFDFQTGNDDLDDGADAEGQLVVNAIAQSSVAVLRLLRAASVAAERTRATVAQIWLFDVLQDQTYTVKLQARKTAGTGTSQAMITNTKLIITRLAIIG